MKRRNFAKLAILLAVSLLLVGLPFFVAFAQTPTPTREAADIGSFPIGTGSYLIAAVQAKVISSHTSIKATVKPMSGGVVYDPMVNKGELAMAGDFIPSLARAYRGTHEWEGKKLANLRLLSFSHMFESVLVVRRDSGITKVSQLKGKRVTSEMGGDINGHFQTEVWLRSGGLTWADVIRVPVASSVDSVKAIQEGRVDAAFGMSPTSPTTVEADRAVGLLPLSMERGSQTDKAFNELLPGCGPVLRKAPYGILKADTWCNSLPCYLVASTHMKDAVAYEVVKAIWENHKEIQPAHVVVKNFTPEQMVVLTPVPYHPGAIKFYKEKGVWTKEMEERQKELLP